jgi:hypothetical protein
MTTLGDTDYTFTVTNLPIITASNASLMVSRGTVLNTDTTNRAIWISRVNQMAVATMVVSGSGASAFKVSPGDTVTLPLSGFVLSISESLTGFADAGGKVNVSLSYVFPDGGGS